VRSHLRLAVGVVAFLVPLAVACGARTGLLLPEPPPDAGEEAGPQDSSVDTLVGFDAPQDVFDAPEEDAEAVDTSFPDVSPIDLCPDAGATLVYVITEQSDLYSFYPPTLEFQRIGTISCMTGSGEPFSMAVDRRGIGYSVFEDGTLHLIDMATAACKDTTFVPDQHGFDTFGMGFVANSNVGDAGETLFVAEGNVTTTPRPNSLGLGTIDVTSLALTFVAPFTPPNPGPELTGTGTGELYGFYTNQAGTGSHIIQIDPATGNQLQDFPLVAGQPNDGYAFAYWGGVFWVFTTDDGVTTTVTRFDPISKSESDVTTLGEGIVGAGVSTCAPQ
jgi:hypothetical protein